MKSIQRYLIYSFYLYFQMEEGINIKVEQDFESNPWSVQDASVFLKYCCPECDYQILNLQLFSNHALSNHSKSIALFGEENEKDKIYVKEENLELENNEKMYENSNEEIETDDYSVYSDTQYPNLENSQIVSEEYLEPKQNGKLTKPSKPNLSAKSKQYQSVQDMTICKLCDKDFPNWHKLQKHKIAKHPETKDSAIPPCDLCNFQCASINQLEKHTVQVVKSNSNLILT